MSEPKKFLSVKHIVFMIIVQVLAFNNIPRCYYQMGYSATLSCPARSRPSSGWTSSAPTCSIRRRPAPRSPL